MGKDAAPSPGNSGLLSRVLSALVMLPIAIGLLYLGDWPFKLLLLVAFGLMYDEWLGLIGFRGLKRYLSGGSALIVAAVFFVMQPATGIGVWLIGLFLSAAMLMMAGYALGSMVRWAGLGLLYCALPVIAFAWMRDLENGLAVAAWVFLLVWATDVGGYFAGRFIGGPKLLPRVSPKKTWAGLFGAIALAALAGALIHWAFDYAVLDRLVIVSALLAVFAQAGDMTESAIKRHFNVKDSGKMIPGHGGILDRVDGLVFVAPVVSAWVAMTAAG